MSFAEIKELLLSSLDEAKNVEELIDIMACRIYEQGFDDGVEVGKWM